MKYILAILSLASISAIVQQDDLLDFSIKIPNKEVKSYKDLKISLHFKNVSKKVLLFPQPIGITYAYDTARIAESGNVIFELERMGKREYIKQKASENRHSYLVKKHYDTLAPQKEINFRFSLFMMYNFEKGYYRCRARFIVPQSFNIDKECIYSNWEEFHIADELQWVE